MSGQWQSDAEPSNVQEVGKKMNPKKKPNKTKATVSFTPKLLKKLTALAEAHFKPKLGMDRSDLICFYCERGLLLPLPESLADLGARTEEE